MGTERFELSQPFGHSVLSATRIPIPPCPLKDVKLFCLLLFLFNLTMIVKIIYFNRLKIVLSII